MKKYTWLDIACNSATIAAANTAELEDKISEISLVVEQKCGHKPNFRRDGIKGEDIFDGEMREYVLLGYSEDKFDPSTVDGMTFNPKRFARIVLLDKTVKLTTSGS